jgi:hypothetical protein
MTALEALNAARRNVNDIAKKSLVQIMGKKGKLGVTPKVWHVVFYDPYAEQNGTLVEVGAGGVESIRDGYTQMNKVRVFAYKMEEIIDASRIKIDSKDVLRILKKTSALSNIEVTGLDLWLRKISKGPLAAGIWRADVFSAPPHSDKEIRIGWAEIHSETGQILDLRLEPKKVAPK